MHDDGIVLREPLGDFGRQGALASQFDASQQSPLVFHAKYGPAIAVTEQCARGNFKNALFFPDDDFGFHAKAITQRGRNSFAIGKIGDDENALLFDSQGRDLGVTRGFDDSYSGLERTVAAPLFQQHPRPGSDLDGVAGENFDFNFQIWSPSSISGVPAETTARFLQHPQT